MAGNPEAVVREMFSALDRGDADSMLKFAASDMLGIDEVARHWLRGRGKVGDHVRQLTAMVSDLQSELSDVHELSWDDDSSIVTCWLEQDYTVDGERHHISAPTSVVLRREEGQWRIVLFHSVPLPPEAA